MSDTSSPARRNLFSRLEAFRDALTGDALKPSSIASAERDPAQLLRNGLAVIAFAMLEDFVRSRTQELLAGMPGRRSFSDLPEKLRIASRRGALDAALLRARYVANRGEDPQAFLVVAAQEVASTASRAPSISQWSLGHGSSNLQASEVGEILNAVNVGGSWECLNQLARRAGSGGFVLRDAFRELGKRRHHAAHDGSASIPITDLETAPDQITALAFAFDAVCSMAVKRFLSGVDEPTEHADVRLTLLRVDHSVRTVEDDAGKLLATVPRSVPVRKLVAAFGGPVGTAVMLDRRRLPISWVNY